MNKLYFGDNLNILRNNIAWQPDLCNYQKIQILTIEGLLNKTQ